MSSLSSESHTHSASATTEDEKSATTSREVENRDVEDGRYDEVLKTGSGITLIPHPSDDPRDPLTWPMRKKIPVVAALCLATFAGFSSGLCGQLVPVPQSKLYKVTTTQMQYQNSISNAGMIVGGFIFFPLSHKIGRSSTILWSLFGLIFCQIWSGLMTEEDDYAKFLGSRFMSGFFGTVTGVLGPRILLDLFFLHQRGRAFTIFHYWFDLGTMAGPTLGAFVAAGGSWTYAYWYTALLAATAFVVCFVFLQETAWDRAPGAKNSYHPPTSFLANRIATFFPGTKAAPYASFAETLRVAVMPFKVAIQPVTICLGLFTLIGFGFYVAMNAITPVWLQKPEKFGGYGFTSMQNALFSFAHWAGLLISLIYGHLISDRLPLYLCSRNGGVWKPEFRLHALWIPALICNPIGIGIFGVALQKHWSWGFLALGQVMVTFGSMSITPITVNYACEVFKKNPSETAIILNAYRIGYGLSVAFYINPWVDLMDFNWTYGMMAFLQIFSFLSVLLLMWKGHEIRKVRILGVGESESEDGEHVLE